VSETEHVSRQTTIADRPAADVLTALISPDIEVAREALTDIYETYFTTLWDFAYRWTRSRDQAKELVHDIFLDLWTRRTTLDLRGEIIFYLRSAVRKQVYNVAKHTAVVARMEAAVEGEIAGPPAIGRVIDPDIALEEAEIDRIVAKALAGISQRDRDVVIMRWIDRMTLDEIASEFGISKSRVRTILAKAVRRIAPALNRLQK
jgi:RNA polymerase sigma-70 factor (ECF subfamily)